ncbi:hypothetical protein ACIRIR_34410 [Streptomyces globisporus]|uniref:hypothetical protein n=1 Tax=Streptomyces globisporus TaxID=1908 RepID=UPI00382737FA
MSTPTNLRGRAQELENRVSPVTAGPRTDDERMWLEKAAALRAEADRVEAAAQREAMYEAGENSGHAAWENALDDLLPDGVEPLPTQVAEYVRKLQQENARLRAVAEQ